MPSLFSRLFTKKRTPPKTSPKTQKSTRKGMLTGRQTPTRTVSVELSEPYGEDSDDGAGVFGRTSRKQTTQQAPPDAIIKATTRIAEIDTAIEKINTEIKKEVAMAIEYSIHNNKQDAKYCMKRKKLYEAQLKHLESSKSKLQKQIDEISKLRKINENRNMILAQSANASDKGKTISELSPTVQGVLHRKSARKNSIRTRPWESYGVKPNLINSALRQVLHKESGPSAPLTVDEQRELAELMRNMELSQAELAKFGQEDIITAADIALYEEVFGKDSSKGLRDGGTRKRRKHKKHKKKH